MPRPFIELAQYSMGFSEYLQRVYQPSDWWVWRRARYLSAREQTTSYECYFSDVSNCGGHYCVVHHLHYESLTDEQDADLELICGAHHGEFHAWQRAQREHALDHVALAAFAAGVLRCRGDA